MNDRGKLVKRVVPKLKRAVNDEGDVVFVEVGENFYNRGTTDLDRANNSETESNDIDSDYADDQCKSFRDLCKSDS